MFLWLHFVIRVGKHGRSEYHGQVRWGHQVLIALTCENGEEVEEVQQQVLIRSRHRPYQSLVRCNHLFLIIRFFGYRNAEIVVHIKGYYGFRHLREVSSKYTRNVVGSESFVFPIEIFAISWGRLESRLEVPHPFVAAIYSKRTLDLGCCVMPPEE